MASDSDSTDVEMINSQESSPGKSGRKNIRKVLKDKQVTEDTKQAAKEEEERLKRIAERQALVYPQLYYQFHFSLTCLLYVNIFYYTV